MDVSCEEGESGAARSCQSVESEDLSKNNEEGKWA